MNPTQSGLYPAAGRWLALASPAVVIALAELFKQFQLALPVPFLLLVGAVVLSASVAGLAGAISGSIIAGAYFVYAWYAGFGPPALVGEWSALVAGLLGVTGIAFIGGYRQERSERRRRILADYDQAHYRALVDDAPETICVVDPRGTIIRGNPVFYEMFGLDPETTAIGSVADISPERQPDGRDTATAAREYIEHAINTGPITFEWTHQTVSGTPLETEVSLSALPGKEEPLVRGAIRDIGPRKRIERLRLGESEILRQIARDAPLDDTLDRLARLVEAVLPESIGSILMLDEPEQTVRHGAAPNLSERFLEAIDGLPIGPSAGSCGTAMYRDETIIVEDIPSDPLWQDYLELTEIENVRACWSVPIHDSRERVVGSFAVYFRHPRGPAEGEMEVLESLQAIAGLAIEHARQSSALKHNESLYRATFEQAAVGMAHLTPDGRYLRVNEEYSRMLGYSPEELTRMSNRDVTHPDDIEADARGLDKLVSGEQDTYYTEKRCLRKDGKTVWVNLSVGIVRDEAGRVERLVAVAQDVSKARELSDQLAYEARHDALTGLINRREFEHQLAEVLQEVNRNEQIGACLYLDLDQFKLVNDTAGHIAGDALLKQLSPVLKQHIRQSDILARLGGDEFGVLLRGCPEEATLRVAKNILRSIQEYVFTWKEQNYRLSASIGAVQLEPDKFHNITDVLQVADTVCYAAKDAGRDRVVLWEEEDASLYERRGEMEWIPRLNAALESKAFYLVGQTIQPLAQTSDEPDWMELLIRLNDQGTTTPPGAFMPAAERYGLSPKIDWYVINCAIDWLRDKRKQGENWRASINLSGASLSDQAFRKNVINRFREIGDLGHSICIEITETAAIANLGEALQLMESLREFGCRFALDDFGSGLSSFSYLATLPIDYIKIDGAFVREINTDPTHAAIVRAIQDVSRTMEIRTIAEFVESAEILDALNNIGVDYAQGFHIHRPAPLYPDTVESDPDATTG